MAGNDDYQDYFLPLRPGQLQWLSDVPGMLGPGGLQRSAGPWPISAASGSAFAKTFKSFALEPTPAQPAPAGRMLFDIHRVWAISVAAMHDSVRHADLSDTMGVFSHLPSLPWLCKFWGLLEEEEILQPERDGELVPDRFFELADELHTATNGLTLADAPFYLRAADTQDVEPRGAAPANASQGRFTLPMAEAAGFSLSAAIKYLGRPTVFNLLCSAGPFGIRTDRDSSRFRNTVESLILPMPRDFKEPASQRSVDRFMADGTRELSNFASVASSLIGVATSVAGFGDELRFVARFSSPEPAVQSQALLGRFSRLAGEFPLLSSLVADAPDVAGAVARLCHAVEGLPSVNRDALAALEATLDNLRSVLSREKDKPTMQRIAAVIAAHEQSKVSIAALAKSAADNGNLFSVADATSSAVAQTRVLETAEYKECAQRIAEATSEEAVLAIAMESPFANLHNAAASRSAPSSDKTGKRVANATEAQASYLEMKLSQEDDGKLDRRLALQPLQISTKAARELFQLQFTSFQLCKQALCYYQATVPGADNSVPSVFLLPAGAAWLRRFAIRLLDALGLTAKGKDKLEDLFDSIDIVIMKTVVTTEIATQLESAIENRLTSFGCAKRSWHGAAITEHPPDFVDMGSVSQLLNAIISAGDEAIKRQHTAVYSKKRERVSSPPLSGTDTTVSMAGSGSDPPPAKKSTKWDGDKLLKDGVMIKRANLVETADTITIGKGNKVETYDKKKFLADLDSNNGTKLSSYGHYFCRSTKPSSRADWAKAGTLRSALNNPWAAFDKQVYFV